MTKYKNVSNYISSYMLNAIDGLKTRHSSNESPGDLKYKMREITLEITKYLFI